MKVKIVKNPVTYTLNKKGEYVPYGWMVFPIVKYDGHWELDECPLHLWNHPFKTKKNAIKAVKNGKFEKDGVTGISYAKLSVDKPYPIW